MDGVNGKIAALLTVIAFAVYPSVVPIGIASGVGSLTFIVLALVISLTGVSVLVYSKGASLWPPPGERRGVLILSLIFLLEHLCLLATLTYLKVPVAMSIIYMYPLCVGVACIILGKENRLIALIVSSLLAFFGVFLLLSYSAEAVPIIGVVLAAAQCAMATAKILLTSHIVQGQSGIVLTGRVMFFAALVAVPALLIWGVKPPTTTVGWAAVLAAGFSGMIGHSALMVALSKLPAAHVALIMFLEPVAAAILACLLAGQTLTPFQYVGACLVILSVAGFQLVKR